MIDPTIILKKVGLDQSPSEIKKLLEELDFRNDGAVCSTSNASLHLGRRVNVPTQ